MGEKNKYGLGRTVPAAVKREIRQRCGFGCVNCGLAYYDYEHFEPDFKDAREHNPNGMTLLCPCCNQKRARGTLSAESVSRANQNPKCKTKGYTSEMFDFGSDPIDVKFYGLMIYGSSVLVHIKGNDVLSVRPPEEPGSPVLLSGLFADSSGAITLKIVDNEWSSGDENWDIESVGPVTTIRRGSGDIALQFRVLPPKGIAIERINMEFDGLFLDGDKETLKYSWDGVSWSCITNCVALAVGRALVFE